MNFDFNRLYFSTDGRIGRQQFWIGLIVLAIAAIVIAVIASAIAGGMMTRGGQVATFIIQLIFAYPSYCLMAKRFQDRDKPAMYAAIVVGINLLISLLTILGLTGDPLSPNALAMIFGLISLAIFIWIVVELGILRGTVGSNQYGPDPVGP
jgi:uncharacterized membrane protein YhaH (DUF805 family)